MACKRAKQGSCSVFGCTNEPRLYVEPLKNQWVNFIVSGNDAPVCAKHFTEDYFLNLDQYRGGLAERLDINSGSVPTFLGSATSLGQASTSSAYIQLLLSRDVACQTDHLETHAVGTQLSCPQFKSEEDGDASGGRSTQRGATSEGPGHSGHASGHSGELRILSVYGKGEGPLAVDGHDATTFPSLCGKQLTPDTISIKVEEDIGGGMPAVDGNNMSDCSTQRGATSESRRVDAPGPSHMSGHSGELRIVSVYGQGEGPPAADGRDTLLAASEPEALSPLSADRSAAKSLNCSVRLVHLVEPSGHRGGRKGRPGVLSGKVFPNNANMIIHMRTHTGEKPYKCAQCTKSFRESSKLKVHVRTHTGEKPYKCAQCTKSFGQTGTLKRHMMTHSGEKPYRCDQCTKSFNENSKLKLHLRTHTDEKPYRCDRCTKSFRQKFTLTIHTMTHTGEKPYKCAQCTKSFGTIGPLKLHTRTHTGEKPHRCDRCTKSFGQKGTLKHHMMTHSGEKPYRCDQCTACFCHGSALKIHMRTHTGEKPYRCVQCTMRFSRKSSLKIHMRTHSG